MKRTLKYIVIALLFPLLSSCIFEEVIDVVDRSEDEVAVTFTLDAGSHAMTKADENVDWGNADTDDVGDSFENRINATSIIVFAYSADGDFIAQLPVLKMDRNTSTISFLCAFKEAFYKYNNEFKIVVLANCVNSQYGLAYNGLVPNLNDLIYLRPKSSTTNYIPMWGIKKHTLVRDASGAVQSNQDLGEISLLRAMGKIGVSLSQDLQDQGFKLAATSVKLNYARSTGYSVPNTWNLVDVNETMDLYHNKSFKPYGNDEGVTIDKNINPMGYDDNGGVYLYVPETRNNDLYFSKSSEEDPAELSLSLTINKGDKDYEFTYANGIKFRDYENGLPNGAAFDIMRNHYYDFVVTGLKTGLELDLTVAEWEDEPVWDLDFSAPVHSKLMTAPAADAAAPTEVPVVRYDNSDASGEAGAFVGYFMMESPKGMTWRPTLANASSADYEVRIYKTNGVDDVYNILVTEDAVETEQDYFYKIVVVAKNPNNIGNVIKLGITYTADWNPEANPLLLINKGEGSGLYYPWDAEAPGVRPSDSPDIHWISIIQQ